METYTEPKNLVENPHYIDQRRKCLAGLRDGMIDVPIVDVIQAFNRLPYGFTLQSCYGHFVYQGQKNSHNLAPLPITDAIASVTYRIAYICLCVENSDRGWALLEALNEITVIDPDNIQFCCAEWFWKRQVNSYALQVQPNRFKDKDSAVLDYREALQIEKIRNMFFNQVRDLLLNRYRNSIS